MWIYLVGAVPFHFDTHTNGAMLLGWETIPDPGTMDTSGDIWRHGPGQTPEEGAGDLVIAVADFANVGQDPELQGLIQGIPESVTTYLARKGMVRIVERGRLESALKELQLGMKGIVDEETAAEVGKAVGASAIMVGSFLKIGDMIRINARVIDVETGEVIMADQAQGMFGEVFGLMDKVAEAMWVKLRRGKGEAVSPVSDLEVAVEAGNMVLIPGGLFQMGHPSFGKVQEVWVDAFYIDKYEVTVGQYKAFIVATGRNPLPDWISQYSPTDDHPVVGVSWHDAAAYCNWRSRNEGLHPVYNEMDWEVDFTKNGYRLFTEAEWEKAARGGLKGKTYTWGDEERPNGRYMANYNPGDYMEDGHLYTAPVGSFPPNGYGLYDMAGNVWEWCNDRYDENYYNKVQPKNPTGPSTGTARAMRGGSWVSNALMCVYRDSSYPNYTFNNIGFRCVRRR